MGNVTQRYSSLPQSRTARTFSFHKYHSSFRLGKHTTSPSLRGSSSRHFGPEPLPLAARRREAMPEPCPRRRAAKLLPATAPPRRAAGTCTRSAGHGGGSAGAAGGGREQRVASGLAAARGDGGGGGGAAAAATARGRAVPLLRGGTGLPRGGGQSARHRPLAAPQPGQE